MRTSPNLYSNVCTDFEPRSAGAAHEQEQPTEVSAAEVDPLFDPPALVSSSTGARVLLTTAEVPYDKPATLKAATLHIWTPETRADCTRADY